jgi:hypothetical protein
MAFEIRAAEPESETEPVEQKHLAGAGVGAEKFCLAPGPSITLNSYKILQNPLNFL